MDMQSNAIIMKYVTEDVTTIAYYVNAILKY